MCIYFFDNAYSVPFCYCKVFVFDFCIFVFFLDFLLGNSVTFYGLPEFLIIIITSSIFRN
jgi:hypothetical protein